MTPRRLTRLLAAPSLALALSACISVLPKTKPDQLYSFGHGVEAQAPGAPGPAGPGAGIRLAAIGFPRAATGDGILTMTGSKIAYIAQSRWIGPASVLFRESVERAFDRSARRTRLISRGETGVTPLTLRLDVRDFEALYPNGPDTPPTVLVSVRARLTRADGQALDERSFDVRKPAGENRVGPIVEAFDQATAEALNGLVAWSDQAAAALPPPTVR